MPGVVIEGVCGSPTVAQRDAAAVKYWLGIAYWPTVPVTPGELRSLDADTPVFAGLVRAMQARGLRRVAGESVDVGDLDATAPRLLSWRAAHLAPIVETTCPRCGIRGTRTVRSWEHTGRTPAELVSVMVACASCTFLHCVVFVDRPGVTS